MEELIDHTATLRGEIKSKKSPLWRSALVLALLIFTLVACQLFQGIETRSEPGVNMDLPGSLGNFLGFDQAISEGERVILPSDTEFAKKRYVGFGSAEISAEIVLTGAHRQSIHRPQVCLVGQGWTIQKEERIPIKLADGRVQMVRNLVLSRNQSGVQVVGNFLYWFVGTDKTTDDHLERLFLTSWDRIMHRVNHRWAYVIVSSILPPEAIVTDQKRTQLLAQLTDFTRELIPKIQRAGGSDR
jgi:hypothetical protein